MEAALALFGMTMPGAGPNHGLWATCFLRLILRGSGAISLEALIARRLRS
ncbi:hypothetical protein [Ancylobacter sp. G4_0304]